jgi:hypothetical protein
MHRISVVANNEVVPIFSGKPLRDSSLSPWKDLLVEVHDVGPIEVPEHEHSSLCLNMQTSVPVELAWWFDGKGGRTTTNAGSLILIAPGTVDALKFNRPSRRFLVAVEESMLCRAASELEEALWNLRDSPHLRY